MQDGDFQKPIIAVDDGIVIGHEQLIGLVISAIISVKLARFCNGMLP